MHEVGCRRDCCGDILHVEERSIFRRVYLFALNVIVEVRSVVKNYEGLAEATSAGRVLLDGGR